MSAHAVSFLQYDPADAPVATSWSDEVMTAINLLRLHAMQCRVSARVDLFRACQMLAPEASDARAAFATALVRVLGDALDRHPVFHRPGTMTLSFDEAWLARLLDCRLRDDEPSMTFLAHRRVTPIKRRALLALVTGFVRATQ